MIVDQQVLPGLVRATAINASRAKRSMLTYYQTHFEERSKALESIVINHKENSTFEDFVTNVYSPRPLTNLFQHTGSRPVSLLGSASLGSHQFGRELEQQQQQMQHQQLAFSNSTRELKASPRSAKIDLTHTLSTPPHAMNNNNGNFGLIEEDVSPRGGKKLSFKTSSSIQTSSKRPLTIKEEPGLPDQTSPHPVLPPRKR